MKKVLTSQQMREVDRRTTDDFGLPSIDLMENAARAVVDVILGKFGVSVDETDVLVLAGKGNNGGDGAAVARLLGLLGAKLTVVLCGTLDETKGDARVNFERLADCGIDLHELTGEESIFEFWDDLPEFEILIDAVFGTGLDRPVEGKAKTILETAQDFAVLKNDQPLLVSIDLPSGINSDLPEPIGYFFKPDLTVTFTAPKPANVLAPACHQQGELFVRDIGSPFELIDDVESNLFVSEMADAAKWMSETAFTHDSYKKTRGRVLIIAGSKAYPGAAVLATNGAMRSGAGMVTVATPESASGSVSERILPEVMIKAVSESPKGAFNSDSFEELRELFENTEALAIGCGITSEEVETRDFVRRVIESSEVPVVIDADGLNAIAPYTIETRIPIVLTPHVGEFRRLIGEDIDRADWSSILSDFAVKHGVICVLKGERTLIAAPDGRVVVNPTGNPGLGKAGNGDNLAGLIAGFIAQSMAVKTAVFEPIAERVFRAVVAAVYVGGLAGDIAAERFGKRVMTASDVRESLSEAFRQVQNDD